MIYYEDGNLTIRNMETPDAQVFADEERAQGWHADAAKYLGRIRDMAEGRCVSLTAVFRGNPAGYVNLYLNGSEGSFAGRGYPVIVDFGVLEKYRRRGIGTRLMDTAERIAAGYADTVYLSVGLHDGYGSAQRMYVKRGYIPDGSGVWYRNRPCTPYDTVFTNDDDMVLFLSKPLSAGEAADDGSSPADTAGAISEDGVSPACVVRAAPGDEEEAAALACLLWPHANQDGMISDMRALLEDGSAAVFLYRTDGRTAGFAQCQLRHDYVEGTSGSPVGYLEGIFVREKDRLQGIARSLLRACMDWARQKGCAEFASDCELDNAASQRFHQAVGFRETNRIVAYVRKL